MESSQDIPTCVDCDEPTGDSSKARCGSCDLLLVVPKEFHGPLLDLITDLEQLRDAWNPDLIGYKKDDDWREELGQILRKQRL